MPVEIPPVTLITAIVGASTGLTGVVLGVLNFYRDVKRNSTRMMVQGRLAVLSKYWSSGFRANLLRICCVFAVRNLSPFEVVITGISFLPARFRFKRRFPFVDLGPKGHLPVWSQNTPDVRFPMKIPPRSLENIEMSTELHKDPVFMTLSSVVVKTGDGTNFKAPLRKAKMMVASILEMERWGSLKNRFRYFKFNTSLKCLCSSWDTWNALDEASLFHSNPR